jgi:hypothetical protein
MHALHAQAEPCSACMRIPAEICSPNGSIRSLLPALTDIMLRQDVKGYQWLLFSMQSKGAKGERSTADAMCVSSVCGACCASEKMLAG